MFNSQISQKGDLTVLQLDGVVDDRVDFEKLVAPLPKSLKILCGGLKRFNSIGVKKWIQFFEQLTKCGVSIEFEDCSPAVVELCNSYRNFLVGMKITSVQVPFLCSKCSHYFAETSTVDQLKAVKFTVSDKPCPKCGAPAGFDDLSSAYFAFLIP